MYCPTEYILSLRTHQFFNFMFKKCIYLSVISKQKDPDFNHTYRRRLLPLLLPEAASKRRGSLMNTCILTQAEAYGLAFGHLLETANMTLVPKTPKTPSTPRTPTKSLRIPKSTLKNPRSLKAPRTLRTPRRLKASGRRSAKTPRANAKPLTIRDMVFEAVEALNDRRGVSLHSIKKYLRDNKKVDTEAKAVSIKKQLKAFVEEGKLVQVAGTGANGTFKIPGKKTTSQKTSACSKVVTKVASRPKIGKIPSGKKDQQTFKNTTNMQQTVSKKALKGKMGMKRL